MTDSSLIVYGTSWCFDCRRTTQWLQEQGVKYEWVDIDDDPEGSAFVQQVNNGNRSVPTLLFPDGSTLTEPSRRELIAELDARA